MFYVVKFKQNCFPFLAVQWIFCSFPPGVFITQVPELFFTFLNNKKSGLESVYISLQKKNKRNMLVDRFQTMF